MIIFQLEGPFKTGSTLIANDGEPGHCFSIVYNEKVKDELVPEELLKVYFKLQLGID